MSETEEMNAETVPSPEEGSDFSGIKMPEAEERNGELVLSPVEETEEKAFEPVPVEPTPKELVRAPLEEFARPPPPPPKELARPTPPPLRAVNPTSATHISITVKAQNRRGTYFKIKRDTELKKLLKSYCQKFFLDYHATSFYLEGQHFNHTKTANQLELDDDVEIDALTDMLGGAALE